MNDEPPLPISLSYHIKAYSTTLSIDPSYKRPFNYNLAPLKTPPPFPPIIQNHIFAYPPLKYRIIIEQPLSQPYTPIDKDMTDRLIWQRRDKQTNKIHQDLLMPLFLCLYIFYKANNKRKEFYRN